MALSKVLMLAVPLGIGLVVSSSKKKKPTTPGIPPAPPSGPPPPPGGEVPAGTPPLAPGKPPVPPPMDLPPPTPGAVIASLPENYGAGREQMILDAVKAGLFEFPDLYVVTSPGQGAMTGYTLQVPVMTDALKIEGVRVNTNFVTAQAIADAIGGFMMMTPYVAGLISEQAHAKLSPTTAANDLTIKHATARKSQMIEASHKVDQKLAPLKAPRDAQGHSTLVSNPGKDWVLTIEYTRPGVHPVSGVPKSEAGANHGLYTSPWNPIQNVGLFHPMDHVDYSQTVRFMGTHSSLIDPQGETTLVENANILNDPDKAHMLTGVAGQRYGKQWGEGRLGFHRHPKLMGGTQV